MSDIVKRLRAVTPPLGACQCERCSLSRLRNEAAAEIERLKTGLPCDYCLATKTHSQGCSRPREPELRAEIERLRALKDLPYRLRQLKEAAADNERLRALLGALVSAVANDETSDTVLRSCAYAEAQRAFLSDLNPMPWVREFEFALAKIEATLKDTTP